MKTTDERMALIAQRADKIKKENKMKKRRFMGAGCAAACIVFVVCLGAGMPALTEGISGADISYGYGAAGMIAHDPKVGYIIMGILSFALGVCVTLIVHKLFKDKGVDNEELSEDRRRGEGK